MDIAETRQQLMIYLADLPDTKVAELYVALKKDLKRPSFTLTQGHINILEKRHAEYIDGKSKPSAWREVHDRIRNKRKNA